MITFEHAATGPTSAGKEDSGGVPGKRFQLVFGPLPELVQTELPEDHDTLFEGWYRLTTLTGPGLRHPEVEQDNPLRLGTTRGAGRGEGMGQAGAGVVVAIELAVRDAESS
jgi:hypothetical protein